MLLDPDLLTAFCGAVDTYDWVLEEAKHHDDGDFVVGWGLRGVAGCYCCCLLICSKPTNDTVAFAFLLFLLFWASQRHIGVSKDSVGDSARRDELRAAGPGRRTRAAAVIREWPIFGFVVEPFSPGHYTICSYVQVFSGWYTVMLISGHVLFYNKVQSHPIEEEGGRCDDENGIDFVLMMMSRWKMTIAYLLQVLALMPMDKVIPWAVKEMILDDLSSNHKR
uniref:Uncharacterized protein n=1 Tax=Oryza nivara TaxID=4536 RepID=A0A0E0IIU0_ORYNI